MVMKFIDTIDNAILAYESPKSLDIPFHRRNPCEFWLYSLHSCDEAKYSTILESKPIPTHHKSRDKPTQSIEQIQPNIDRIQKRAHAVSTVFTALCRYNQISADYLGGGAPVQQSVNEFHSYWGKPML